MLQTSKQNKTPQTRLSPGTLGRTALPRKLLKDNVAIRGASVNGPIGPVTFRNKAHPWDTRSPALCRVRVEWESVLLDQQPSLLTLRRPIHVVVEAGAEVHVVNALFFDE